MTASTRLLFLLGLAVIAWTVARARARSMRLAGDRFGALPDQGGAYALLWTLAPPLCFLLVWALVAPALVTDSVLGTHTAGALPAPGFDRATILSQARAIGAGLDVGSVHPLARTLAPVYAAAQTRHDWLATAATLLLALAGFLYAWLRLRPGFAVRDRVERAITAALLAAALVAILATAGIVASLLWETGRFFSFVPPWQFLFGTHWSPQVVDARDPGATLGAVPLFWGTFLIGAVIAMAVAVPLGLMSAVYLTQYARPRARRWLKPALEVLAGVPTVVYGYFAALTVAPAVRDLGIALGVPNVSAESALAAGLVMGEMIIPYVSSLADDSLAAIPAAMRDGSLAMGATPAETVRRVLIPAALPGVIGGVLLAVSRAIGETMIVVMAASGVATLTANPFAPTTTVTRQIVDLLTGEGAFDSPKTLAAFALGLTLFAITFFLNIVALTVVRRYRQAYE